MRNALTSGQQRISKLLGWQVDIPRHILKPLRRIARGILNFQHHNGSCGLVGCHHFWHALHFMSQTLKGIGQFNGIFQRQLGARPNGEVRGMCGITHQHIGHRAAIGRSVPMHPLIANDSRKFDPMRRAAQVLGVGH